jgi:hypothetical protein
MARGARRASSAGAPAGFVSEAGGRGARASVAVAPVDESATLEQCVTAVAQAERSATFAGEMTAIAGSARMLMRIDVQERLPAAALFRTVSAPGLGVWRGSDAGVKVYKSLKQVTNLSAPADYRAVVRFRWLNADGHLIRAAERRTAACVQPAPPLAPASPTTGEPTAIGGTP